MIKGKLFSKLHPLLFILITLWGLSLACSSNAPQKNETTGKCLPLPKEFSISDLVGTWAAEYSGGDSIDKLQIRSDGTYKQLFSSTGELNFESDWQEWSLEYSQNGYALLHLKGMRRCDGTLAQCNNPGGGLPEEDVVINICDGTPMHYADEVILFVIGSLSSPKGFRLIHARAAGSEWNYSFQLEE